MRSGVSNALRGMACREGECSLGRLRQVMVGGAIADSALAAGHGGATWTNVTDCYHNGIEKSRTSVG